MQCSATKLSRNDDECLRILMPPFPTERPESTKIRIFAFQSLAKHLANGGIKRREQ
ncbi:hypothetical protein M406DRAFT_102531 [Cryphonectria parasitica EP155]|uniref:Uncharacterized protein n=1 Tax=Cryphonectria parasitica (strain ATCC 38755 / EP155) TaxID=660469 RepID=A0A9P4Y120_CRYP1|nr:uncharacterized protein M406DRAFT_102531 [Cryphonectria parasitica EP155]KAF3764576.1 hypothetical protein M406DRAFT_102531 [Cryphonectria parasitica EP155]